MNKVLAHAGLTACVWLLSAAGPAWAADNASLAVSAVIVSKSNCKFANGTAPVATVMNNGVAIDPTLSITATGPATATFTCNGSATTATFTVSANDGGNASGPGLRRMRHASIATEFLPYSLTISPALGTVNKGTPMTVTMTASVLAADYQPAAAGNYSDTVTVTVSP